LDLSATPIAQAKDVANPADSIPQIYQPGEGRDVQTSAPKTPRKKAPASRLISTPKAQTGTGSKRTKKPRDSKAKKPPQPDGYMWRKDGAGWELRKTVYVEDGTGSKVRKRPYVARMAKAVFAEMKRKHKGAALERAIAEWIADHDR
jgi:hypothetical protein